MNIGGISIILLLGICNLLLVFFQLLSGLRIIKVSPKVHKKTGIALVFFALVHGLLALFANLS
jgi:hypothetical protein